MKLAFIEMAGFRGFRDITRFNFPAGFAVLTGRNGVGKSTAFDALDFALTGTISKYDVVGAKGGGLENHLWWIGDRPAPDHYVSVGFVGPNGKIVQLTRRRDGAVNSEDFSALSEALCSSVEEMPAWAETLVRTSLIRDESIAALSFDLSEQMRFAAVRAALGSGEVSDVTSRLKSITKQTEIVREDQLARHKKAQEELGRALSVLTEARSAATRHDGAAAAESIIQSKLSGPLENGKTYAQVGRELIQERRNRLASIRTALGDAERLAAERGRVETPEFIVRMSSQRDLQRELEASLTVLRDRARVASEEFLQAQSRDATLSAYLTLLEAGEQVGLQEGRCPLCSCPREEEQFLEAIRAARSVLQERRPEAAMASSAMARASQEARLVENQLSAVGEELRQMDARLSQTTENRKELEARFASLGLGDFHNADFATQILMRLQEEVSLLEQSTAVLEASGAQDRVVSATGNVEQLRSHVEDEADRLSTAERAHERAIQIEKAAKVVANEMIGEQIDTVLPLLKELYRRLRPHADWREIEIDIAGQVRASLNFSVGNGKNPQFLFSSGQRRAAGLAFLLALHLSRPWCGLEALLLDDPVQHVDDYRALNLVEVLAAVRRSGRQVIVSVQDAALADILCRRLRGTVEESGRRFDLETALDGSAVIGEEREIPALSRTVFQISEAS